MENENRAGYENVLDATYLLAVPRLDLKTVAVMFRVFSNSVSEFIGEHREAIDEEYCGLSLTERRDLSPAISLNTSE